jgi:GNAT superfamily N-acetyltransferase
MVRIRRPAHLSDPEIEGLARVLVDCVEDGASVGFMLPLARGERALLLAEDDAGIVGTVHLVLDQPENQPHRADLSKLLVHRRARRQGVAAALMHAAQALARDSGKTLLVLDTITGSAAERLYTRLGWQRCGVIPGYALLPQGGPAPTTYFYLDVTALTALAP